MLETVSRESGNATRARAQKTLGMRPLEKFIRNISFL